MVRDREGNNVGVGRVLVLLVVFCYRQRFASVPPQRFHVEALNGWLSFQQVVLMGQRTDDKLVKWRPNNSNYSN
jgi:hypothetical protein